MVSKGWVTYLSIVNTAQAGRTFVHLHGDQTCQSTYAKGTHCTELLSWRNVALSELLYGGIASKSGC